MREPVVPALHAGSSGVSEPRRTRDARGRFTPGGGREGGEGGQLVDALRKRLDRLLANPESSPRNIGTLARALVSAQSLLLLEKRILLADLKLSGKSDAVDLEEVARTMAVMDAGYDAEYRKAAGKVS